MKSLRAATKAPKVKPAVNKGYKVVGREAANTVGPKCKC